MARDDVPDAVLDQLEAIFADHRGKDNPITSGEISDKLDIQDSTAQPKTRHAIRQLTRERGVPVAGCSRGYYVIEDDDELHRYLHDLTHRAQSILDRKQIVLEAYGDDDTRQARITEVGVDA